MHNNDPSAFRWEEWDWRPLARVAIWLIIGGAWATARGGLSLGLLERVVREVVLGWLLSFGLLTYIHVLLATGAVRLALSFDDFAYGLSERIVRAVLGPQRFAAAFVAAFGLEMALVLLLGHLLPVVLR